MKASLGFSGKPKKDHFANNAWGALTIPLLAAPNTVNATQPRLLHRLGSGLLSGQCQTLILFLLLSILY